MNISYEPHEIRLANEIATGLDDMGSVAWHLQNTRRYTEEYMRKRFNHVMALPESSIKKSRAALYAFLINQGAKYGNFGS